MIYFLTYIFLVVYLADPPNFVDQFQPVTRLLTCERMYRLLQLCLARYADDDKCSEEQVEQVLFCYLSYEKKGSAQDVMYLFEST